MTLARRGEVATQCVDALTLTMPTVVDDMNDTVNQLYKAWPERIYILNREGVITYKGGLGPFGFDPKEAEQELQALLGSK